MFALSLSLTPSLSLSLSHTHTLSLSHYLPSFMQHLTAAHGINSSNEAVTQEVDTIVEKTQKALCLIQG